jgi:hypothetical protein
VPGIDNPADLPSRGIVPQQLVDSQLWWNGPTWLSGSSNLWPSAVLQSSSEAEAELRPVKTNALHSLFESNLLEKYSKFSRLIRTTAWLLRFISRCRRRAQTTSSCLTVKESDEALNFWVKRVQAEEYEELIKSITKKNPVQKQFASLSPFLDEDGLLRVGGRLHHCNISNDRKHPLILPGNNHLSKLIISNEHIKLLHGGAQLTLASLRQKYWIVGARKTVRDHIHQCVICIRQRETTMNQMMGDLPRERVRPTRPFLSTGVDFGGPFQIKTMKGRGGKLVKAYICLFSCLSTKAIHIELVSDLTSVAFLAAFRRLMGKRGRVANLHSDNGTNFVGADNEMKKLLKQTLSTTTFDALANEGVQWQFIPARGPHFGGLWEAGIKSVKNHLKRILGSNNLTYEEMTTVLTQIEGCLNSRPLIPMSEDPDDLAVLTPGHFLLGEPLNSLPEPDLTDVKINRLSRWQLTQQLTQHFWRRWQQEYLSTLQQRPKWKQPQKNLEIGDLVIVKEENLPATKWALGRIVDVHPGADQRVRVASIKTTTGISKRPITKLVLLIHEYIFNCN